MFGNPTKALLKVRDWVKMSNIEVKILTVLFSDIRTTRREG